MTNRVSPFAALTGAEKQIKWLEYQSVRLPYIQSGMEDVPEAKSAVQQPGPAAPPARREQPALSQPETPARQQRPVPPPEIPRGPAPQRGDFQRTRHSQYDAVIARLKQAELQAGNYRTMS
mgnify:FL=1